MPYSKPLRNDDVFDLADDELDRLPYGVITLDRDGKILRYNLCEANLASRTTIETIGRDFFTEVAPCTNVQAFRGRFDAFAQSRESGVECFDFTFRFKWGLHDVSITMLRKAAYEAINLLVHEWAPERREPRVVDEGPPSESSPADFERFDPAAPSVAARLETPEILRLGGPEEAALRCLIHPDDRSRVAAIVAAATAGRAPYAVEYRRLDPDGTIAIVQEIGVLARAPDLPDHAALLDVTARRTSERDLWRAAHHDALTGLPNRKLLLERINAATHGGARLSAVLLVNIDRFRETNDMFGREIGNQLLRMLAVRLAAGVGGGDTVAHLGLDIFGVLLRSVESASEAAATASALLLAASTPFAIDGHSYSLTASIGISLAPADGSDPNTLLRCAYTAMRTGKAAGRNAFYWYRSEMSIDAAKSGRQINALRAAIENGELELHYQPIVDIAQDRIVAVEALARWTHPIRGSVPPSEFIDLADRTGLIVPLGEWALREACRQAREWNDLGFDLRMCVNVSAVQFRQPNFISNVAAILAATGLEPSRLEIELTETVMVDGIKEMMERLARLKALGIRLAIDDFGTGYSSLAYLKYFPVDTLKIDRAFVTDIAGDSFDRAIATTVFTLANALGLDCVVEGVENEEQLDTLDAIGCHVMQGFYFCRPMTPSALRGVLADSRSTALVLGPAAIRSL